MSTIGKWKERQNRKKKPGGRPILPTTKRDIQSEVDSKMLDTQAWMPASLVIKNLRVDEALDVGSLFDDIESQRGFLVSPDPEITEDGQVLVFREDDTDPEIFPGAWEPADAILPDGTVPGAVTNLTVIGGPRWLAIDWDPVVNHSFVEYDVYVETTSSFDHTTKTPVGTTGGSLFYAHQLSDGSELTYYDDPPTNEVPTVYYVQVIPRDADGESGDTPLEVSDSLDPNASDDITAGAITAEHLEAVMVLATQLIAGTSATAGARIEIGIDDEDSFLGIRAYGSDDTLTFRLDGSTGAALLRGVVEFGRESQSSLTASDELVLDAQPSSGYYDASLVQSAGNGSASGSGTGTATWPTATTVGNQLLMILILRDTDASPPTPSNPSGWTLVHNVTDSGGGFGDDAGRLLVWRNTADASRDGTETVTFGDTCTWDLALLEFSGLEVQAEDDEADDTNKDSTASTGTSGTTTDSESYWLAIFGSRADSDGTKGGRFANNFTNGFESIYSHYTLLSGSTMNTSIVVAGKQVSSTGTVNCEADNTNGLSAYYLGTALAFTRKVVPDTPTDPSAGTVKVYARTDLNDYTTLWQAREDGWNIPLFIGGADLSRFSYCYAELRGGVSETDPGGDNGYLGVATGTSANVNGSARAGRDGCWDCETGTQKSENNTNGRAAVANYSNHLRVADGRIRVGTIMTGGDVGGTARNGTDSFMTAAGLLNSQGGFNDLVGNTLSGFILRQNTTSGSPYWEAQICDGATLEQYIMNEADSLPTGWSLGDDNQGDDAYPVTEASWYQLEIDVDPTESLCKFWINGNHVLTVDGTANGVWPVTTTMRHMAGIQKTEGSAVRIASVDAMWCMRAWNSPRWT
jgi:hypothetical protein